MFFILRGELVYLFIHLFILCGTSFSRIWGFRQVHNTLRNNG